jgi:hypothetical protein
MKTKKHSLALTDAEIAGLEKHAARTDSFATTGLNTGRRSWRVFVADVGAGKIAVGKRVKN